MRKLTPEEMERMDDMDCRPLIGAPRSDLKEALERIKAEGRQKTGQPPGKAHGRLGPVK